MFEIDRKPIKASIIARFLQRRLFGNDVEVDHPSSFNCPDNHSILFLGNRVVAEGLVDIDSYKATSKLLVFAPAELAGQLQCSHIISPNPRIDFVKTIEQFWLRKPKPSIHPTAILETGCTIGKDVFIGPNAYIGPSVSIGDHSMIHNNVVISGNVRIGMDCVIKPQAVIGSEGFSFSSDGEQLIHFPQIGIIEIGDRVWIGSNSCVERAALEVTRIENDVKIDDLVQIGHNCTVGANSQITAGSVLCGRATIGKSVWIAPNVCVNSDISIGDGAFVGMGAVVMKNVENCTVVVGNPAKFLKRTSELPIFQ